MPRVLVMMLFGLVWLSLFPGAVFAQNFLEQVQEAPEATLVVPPLPIPEAILIEGDAPDAVAPEQDALAGVPPELEKWSAWVLHDKERHFCPSKPNNSNHRICAFPTKLSMELDAAGGVFTFSWDVYAEEKVLLPFTPQVWPEEVVVDGQKAVLGNNGGRPEVRLTPGEHTLMGRFSWSELPEYVQLPLNTGLIQLTVEDAPVPFPDVSENGRLMLKRKAAPEKRMEDALDVAVFRLIDDGAPMKLSTFIRLEVSGKARKITLENILPADSTPTKVSSSLPLKFGPDHSLIAQAGPGRWELEVESRLHGPISKLGPLPTPYGDEFWAFQARGDLRVVEVRGVPAVDPQVTEIPDKWKQYPAFMVSDGAVFDFQELHRGVPTGAPDKLNIRRTAWLDFSGEGMTVKDDITGAVQEKWTISMGAPLELGRVAMAGKDQPIVLLGENEQPGVELRNGNMNMQAESRLEQYTGRIPAMGWDRSFNSARLELRLPPGWRLFTATGVDEVNDSWFSRWNLLDIFLALVISLALFKLQRPLLGLLAILFFALAYHEPGAPVHVWLFLLSALGLMRLFKSETLRDWEKTRRLVMVYYVGALLCMVLIAVPFAFQQLRWGFFPQLEPHVSQHEPRRKLATPMKQKVHAQPDELPAAPPSLSKEQILQEALDVAQESGSGDDYALSHKIFDNTSPGSLGYVKLNTRTYVAKQALMNDPESLVQTGPGLPRWSWRTVNLSWNGPVAQGEEVELWLIPPGLRLFFCILRVVLLAAILAPLADLRRLRPAKGAVKGVAAALLVVFSLAIAPSAQASEYPPKELLEQLQQRLLAPDTCYPSCVSSPSLHIALDGERLRLVVEAHAATDTLFPLPQVSEGWRPETILVDESPAKDVLSEDRFLWVGVSKGAHRILVEGAPPKGLSFQMSFDIAPMRVTYEAPEWSILGLSPEGRPEGALRIGRKKEVSAAGVNGLAAEADKDKETYTIPPFLLVSRALTLGLTWEVETVIKRLTPGDEPVILAVPVLAGENVLTEEYRVQDGKVQVNMNPGQREARWTSRLEIADKIQLHAPEDVPWVESWTLNASPIWDVGIQGIPMVRELDSQKAWKPKWRPWPGERVELAITRPKAAPGNSMTIDSVNYVLRPGERLDDNELTLSVRASKGGRHVFSIPENAEVTSFTAKGRDLPHSSATPGVLDFPVSPGEQTVRVTWRQARESSTNIKGGDVDLKFPAVNTNIKYEISRDRWVLFLWDGPVVGPAVRFWSYLAAIMLGAFLMGFIPWAPLKRWEWFLFGVGLSQVEPFIALLAAAWILALGLRKENYAKEGWFGFNVIQLALLGLTVAGFVCLYMAVERGLLGAPAMQIAGNYSSPSSLNWLQDRIAGPLPQPVVFSVPIMVYRVLMLAWSLWLAWSLMKWLKWGWSCFSEGDFWRKPVFKPFRRRNPVKHDAGAASDDEFKLEEK